MGVVGLEVGNRIGLSVSSTRALLGAKLGPALLSFGAVLNDGSALESREGLKVGDFVGVSVSLSTKSDGA